MIAGTVLARVAGGDDGVDPHINFSIRPAGTRRPADRPEADPRRLEAARGDGDLPRQGQEPVRPKLSGAGVLLLSKEALQQRVLADKSSRIYECGREDIATGQIDRRVLAMLEYLRSKGFDADDHLAEVRPRLPDHLRQRLRAQRPATRSTSPTINGVPVTGHQGPGTLTDELIKDVLQLQGTMHPHQVISLEDLPGETSFALPDHYDHVHVGYHPIEAAPVRQTSSSRCSNRTSGSA